MTPRDHIARAQALLDAAADPLDQAAYRGVIAAWTRLAAPALPWSHEPDRRALAQLQREVSQSLTQWAAPAAGSSQCQIECTARVPVTTITF